MKNITQAPRLAGHRKIFGRGKKSGLLLGCFLLAAGLAGGRIPKADGAPAHAQVSSDYFQTPFQNESQFIVESVVSDIAEEVYYAALHRLPDPQSFSVAAHEKSASSQDTPEYELDVGLDPKRSGLKINIVVKGPIWSPAVYQDVVLQLAKEVDLTPETTGTSNNTKLLAILADATAETLEQENQRLSAAMEKDFHNPELHEEAAALLGAFLLRDHSGHFFEIRSPLSRITAHLSMAHFLHGERPYGMNGQMAEAMLLTLINDGALSDERLNVIGANDADALPMIRALRTRNTGDYRLLDGRQHLTRMELVAHFSALGDYVSARRAWQELNDDQKQTIDVVRAANALDYSVEMGHQLLAAVPLELREISTVYELVDHKDLARDGLVETLNTMPERCFDESGGDVHVRVIGWGQWADFLQRHLCYAIQQNYYFLSSMWGVPDEAKAFAIQCDQQFGGLRLYPFVRRFDCADVESYHEAEDDGFKVTVTAPQLVPARCWNELCYKVRFAPLYVPASNPHINEWHNHNPPPGTVYDLGPRLNHPSLISRPDAVAFFEKLHQLAPCDCRLSKFILTNKYSNSPTFEQASNLFQPVLPYSLLALRFLARTVEAKPDQYEKLMLRAAELDPSCYYDLGDYKNKRHEQDVAERYIDKACAADPDAVRVSNRAYERVRYYLEKGQTEKARQIADSGGEVYSYWGLYAKAAFLEETSNYNGAFEWFQKIEERYNESEPVIEFCLRCQSLPGGHPFEPELRKRVGKIFSKGLEKVSVADFSGPPRDGVVFLQQSAVLLKGGMKAGDVVVAVGGIRIRDVDQYKYLVDSQPSPELDLIVWQGDGYHEIKASPPNRRFGVNINNYNPR